jgi:tRNA A37 threonylcarbamoyladenosine biosynthesis protein TsaE
VFLRINIFMSEGGKAQYAKYLLVQSGRLSAGKTSLWRTILHGVAMWMDKLAQRGAKLKL